MAKLATIIGNLCHYRLDFRRFLVSSLCSSPRVGSRRRGGEKGWGEGVGRRAQAHVHEQRLVIKPRATIEVRQNNGYSDTSINIL